MPRANEQRRTGRPYKATKLYQLGAKNATLVAREAYRRQVIKARRRSSCQDDNDNRSLVRSNSERSTTLRQYIMSFLSLPVSRLCVIICLV